MGQGIGPDTPGYGIVGGSKGRPQVRKTHKGKWTPEVRHRFLTHLVETANVRASAKAVEASIHGAYRLRRRDPVFAAQWQAAVNEGFDQLEMELLRRALFGTERTTTRRDHEGKLVSQTVVHQFKDGQALRLFSLHVSRQAAQAARAAAPVPVALEPQDQTLRLEYLCTMLSEMHERMPEEGNG